MSVATCSSETVEHASPRLADQPVFIVGCGRSGTTLMRLMLSAAGGLMIPPECDFLWRAVRRFGPDATLDGRGIADFVALLGGISSFPGLELPLDQLGRELQQRGSAPLRDCIGHVYTSYATR